MKETQNCGALKPEVLRKSSTNQLKTALFASLNAPLNLLFNISVSLFRKPATSCYFLGWGVGGDRPLRYSQCCRRSRHHPSPSHPADHFFSASVAATSPQSSSTTLQCLSRITCSESGERSHVRRLFSLSRINPQATIGFRAKTVGSKTVVFNQLVLHLPHFGRAR